MKGLKGVVIIRKCLKCGNMFKTYVMIEGKYRNLCNRKYCLDCSPFKGHNCTPIHIGNDNHICINCGKPIKKSSKKYCCIQCQKEYEYCDYIKRWKNHDETGRKGNSGQLSGYVRKYIFDKYNNKCCKCGWSEENPFTHTIPLEIEHIDGDWKNSYEENLILLCPNCHSLTSTYRGANRGHGRNITWMIKEK